MKSKAKFLFLSLLVSIPSFSNIKNGELSINKDVIAKYIIEMEKEQQLDIKDLNFLESLLSNNKIKEEAFAYYDAKTRKEIRNLAEYFDIPSEWFYMLFYKECRLNPYATNSISSAQGLIQFMPSTAKNLGTSVEEISKLNAIEQLDLVKIYLERINPSKKFDSFTDLYLAVFFPKAMGKLDTYVIGSHASDNYVQKVATQNKGIDKNKDNSITVEEFTHYANRC